jgi:hypothetical protein
MLDKLTGEMDSRMLCGKRSFDVHQSRPVPFPASEGQKESLGLLGIEKGEKG